MSDFKENNLNLDEIVLAEAKREAMEKLPGLNRTLEYYGKNRSLYISMNGAQRVLNKSEIIDHFRNSPVLFHRTSTVNDKRRFESISGQGLTTIDFMKRAEKIFPVEKSTEIEEDLQNIPYDEEEVMSQLLYEENQMNDAYRSRGSEYNQRYISLSFIPWWNIRGIDKDEPVLGECHIVNSKGEMELGLISIVLDEDESRKIIDKNCDELEKAIPDSDFGKLVDDRTVAFAEALEPLRIAPNHIAGLFLMEGKINKIESEKERNQLRQKINELGLKFKVPIFNYYGDLLWPKEINNQSVMDLIGGRKE